jgi:hypothetical protein
MDEASIPTMDVLRSLGFQPDSDVIIDDGPGLTFDFGNFRLHAGCFLNLRCVEVVVFRGILSTPRTLREVSFELPRKLTSLKQCAAWIVWCLDEHSDDRVFRPARVVRWVEEGRENKKLLPWIKYRAEYEARPSCVVKRDWLRLALKTLAENLADLPQDAAVVFSFDGSVLSIRCDKELIALPGEGLPWTIRFKVAARHLHRLPKRFISDKIGLSIWQSRITLGSRSYEGVLEQSGSANYTQIQ